MNLKDLIAPLIFLISTGALGQSPSATLSGNISDQTGAVIPGATVTVSTPNGKPITTSSDQAGHFQIQSLAPGSYGVTASAKGFAPLSRQGVLLSSDHPVTLNLTLQIQTQEEKVQVQGNEGAPQLDVSPESNASAIVIKGKDLEALSDDPDELQAELQALAGPSAGPNGGQIYIDGFTGGQIPPKSAIREIRINQNPFSAEYDKLGYGRIEIFTKPGSDKFHGQFFFNDSNSVLNSRNPFVFMPQPSYNTDMFDGNFGGPLSKKASFFIDASRRNINEFAPINATILDPNPMQFTEAVPNPNIRTRITPRFDFQLTPNNTLTVRYQLSHDSQQNAGISQLSLPSQAYNEEETEHSIQVSDSQILGAHAVNETRFRWEHDVEHQLPVSAATAVQVQGAFSSGGSSFGTVRDTENNFEFQNYTSISHGNHIIKFGARIRDLDDSNFANANFNGTLVFSPVLGVPALTVYQNALLGLCSPSNAKACPSQITINTGQPQIQFNMIDAGLYAEDEWRARPNLSLTYGLRFETQNHIHDRADFAPRVGFAWGIGSDGRAAPKTVLRAGFGMFYERFGQNLLEQAERYAPGGVDSITLENPTFYAPQLTFAQVAQAGGTAIAPATYQISPDLRAPYTIQSAVSIERQVTKAATLSLTYLNSHGEHFFYIRNTNAPFAPGAPPPNPNIGNVYQYDSEGIYRQNQLIVNGRLALGGKVSLFGFYTLGYANANVSGGGPSSGYSTGIMSSASFLSNSYDPMEDYGRAAFDVRNRALIAGSISMPYGFRLSPFIVVNSGAPYNITTGQDNNGDSIFNDRPILVSSAGCARVTPVGTSGFCTPIGTFNTAISAATPLSSIVPINYGQGPGNATFNLRLSKTFGFGREKQGGGGGGEGRGGPRMSGLGGRGLSGGGGGGGGFASVFGGGTTNRAYNLTFSIMGRNLLNRVNPGLPVGILSSPFFGQSTSIAGGPFSSASANRRIDLQVMFSF
jgi:Carboxypeptidase regulatory-like domain